MAGSVPYGAPAGPRGPGAPAPYGLRWPVQLQYWSAEEVTFRPNRNALITNSPLAAGLFYSSRAAGNAAGRRKARQLSEPQWRVAGTGEVLLDQRGLELTGSWGGSMRVEYAEIPSWQRDQDALSFTVVDYYPLLLRSAAIEELAGWFGRLSDGNLWQELPVVSWQPQVRIAGTEQRDRRFSCAVPEGWLPLTDRAYLANAAQDAVNSGMRLLFMLRHQAAQCQLVMEFSEVSDPSMIQGLNADPGLFERGALRLAGLKAQNANGVVVNRPFVVSMGGERATVLDTTMTLPHIAVRLREVYAGHGGSWFMIAYTSASPIDPRPCFDRFAPDFETLISTWQWRR
jgi:hypothetical protein